MARFVFKKVVGTTNARGKVIAYGQDVVGKTRKICIDQICLDAKVFSLLPKTTLEQLQEIKRQKRLHAG